MRGVLPLPEHLGGYGYWEIFYMLEEKGIQIMSLKYYNHH
jgi:hypothetical protein